MEELANMPLDLTLDQQFTLAKYAPAVKELSQEDAQKHLLEMMRQLMIKDNVIRYLMKSAL
jgi:hypothetical protein